MVSVIIPVFNCEKYLEDCLDSVAAQTFKDIQVVIIDDGSTDNSKKICKRYISRYSNFQYFYKTNGGLSSARNFGLSKCDGQWVFFLDGDDAIFTDSIEYLLSAIKKFEDIDIVSGKLKSVPENFIFSKDRNLKREQITVSNGDELFLQKISNHACGKLFKRTLFNEIKFPEGKYFEDVWTIPELFKKANKTAFTDLEVYLYRDNPKGITSKVGLSKISDLKDAYHFLNRDIRSKNSIRFYNYYLMTLVYTISSYLLKAERPKQAKEFSREEISKLGLNLSMTFELFKSPFFIKVLILKFKLQQPLFKLVTHLRRLRK